MLLCILQSIVTRNDYFIFKDIIMRNNVLLLCKLLLISTIFISFQANGQKISPTKHLPLIEYRSTGNNDYYVIFLTGNGGLRNLAQSVIDYFNSKNVSVLVINTKKYLWKEKGPEQIACDLEKLVDQYNNKWGETKVVFLGYSMGAEVLPFAVNCMEDKYINELKDMILIGPWQKATFKVRLRDYLFEVNEGEDIYSEFLKLKTKRAYVICDDNKYSICHKDLERVLDHDFLEGGHHFGGAYLTLSRLIGKRLNIE